MKIAHPSDKDLNDVKFLWKYCFGDSDAFIEYFFSKYYKKENTLAVFEEGKITSDLMFFPYNIVKGGKEIKAAYVCGVSTHPMHRGGGNITALFAFLEEKLKKEGYEAFFLIPFNFSFYRKYGLECASFLHEYSGEIKSLPKFNTPFKEGGDAGEIYKNFCKNKPLYLVRDKKCEDEFLSDTKEEGGHRFLVDGAQMYYFIQNDTFFAQELIFSDIEGAKKAISFIKSHSAQVKKFVIRSDFSLSGLLCEKNIDIKIKPHVMVKYLNGDTVSPSQDAYFNMIGWV